MADRSSRSRSSARRERGGPPGQGTERLLRALARAAGRGPHARSRGALGGRPQRHGQDHALQRHHGPGEILQRVDTLRRRGAHQPQARRHSAPRHRLRPTRAPAVAVADRGGAPPAGAGIAAARMDDRAHLRRLSAARRAQGPSGWSIVGRRAADAGDLACPAAQPATARDGRADRRPGAGDRRAGRGDPGSSRRGGGRRRPRHRAEYRRSHRSGAPGRHHGEWPGQPCDRVLASGHRPRAPAALAGCGAAQRGRRCVHGRPR